MHITMISPECAPVAKVGGLADVVYGLSRDQQRRGAILDVILPKYDCLRYKTIERLTEIITDLNVPWNGGSIRCSVWSGMVKGLQCRFRTTRILRRYTSIAA